MEHIEPPREGGGGESGRFRSAIVHDGKWDERVITQAAHTGSVSRKFIHGFNMALLSIPHDDVTRPL